MHKRRLCQCIILIPEGINRYHRVICATIWPKDCSKFIEYRMTRIRYSCSAEFSDHNPLCCTILAQRFRVHKAVLISNPSTLDGKAMQQRGAIEEMSESHVAHLPAARAIAQQAALEPSGYLSTPMTLDGLHNLALTRTQPDIRRTVGIITSISIQSRGLRIMFALVVIHLRGGETKDKGLAHYHDMINVDYVKPSQAKR